MCQSGAAVAYDHAPNSNALVFVYRLNANRNWEALVKFKGYLFL